MITRYVTPQEVAKIPEDERKSYLKHFIKEMNTPNIGWIQKFQYEAQETGHELNVILFSMLIQLTKYMPRDVDLDNPNSPINAAIAQDAIMRGQS